MEDLKVLKSEKGANYEVSMVKDVSLLSKKIHDTATNEIYDNFTSSDKGTPGEATCKEGLATGRHVKINNDTEIENYIYRSGNGKVFSITLMNIAGYYDYCLFVEAQGPDTGWWSTAGIKLKFTDMTNDIYSLDIVSTTRQVHTLSFNSKNPKITKIEWINS